MGIFKNHISQFEFAKKILYFFICWLRLQHHNITVQNICMVKLKEKKIILKEYLDKFNNPLCLFPERKQFENKYCKVQKYLIFSWYAENDYVWNSNVLVKKYFDFCKRELFLLCRYPLICFSNVWRNIIWNV